MKKIIILILVLTVLVASCSKNETLQIGDTGASISSGSSDSSSNNNSSGTATANSATGAAITNLSPTTINCENLVNIKTITDLTPTKKYTKIDAVQNVTTADGKKSIKKTTETKVEDGPSKFAESKFESQSLTFDHKAITEQSCEFKPLEDKLIGGNALNFRFVCGPKAEVSQKFNDEKSSSRSVQEGSTGIASFWGVKGHQPIYSFLSGKKDCFVDVEGAVDLKLGEAIGKEIEGKIG